MNRFEALGAGKVLKLWVLEWFEASGAGKGLKPLMLWNRFEASGAGIGLKPLVLE